MRRDIGWEPFHADGLANFKGLSEISSLTTKSNNGSFSCESYIHELLAVSWGNSSDNDDHLGEAVRTINRYISADGIRAEKCRRYNSESPS
jgi:hypothetical protein